MLAFTAARLLTTHGVIERPLLLVEQGRTVEISSRDSQPLSAASTRIDFGDALIAPGYVDLHIHGGFGHDVMGDAPETLPTIERFIARHGVTSYFPTTVSAPVDDILRALERLADAIEKCEEDCEKTSGNKRPVRTGRAAPLGIHLEGPFISHARCGVHRPENLLPPRLETFERFWEAARGRIRILTIAPELEGAIELIKTAAARAVCVSLGHSDADFPTAERAIAAGARHATHTFNAMRPLRHRDPGIVGAVLTDARVSADFIADGVHLDPSIIKLIADTKGPEQTVLITDAIAGTGMPDGRYRLGTLDVDVKGNLATSNGRLAGSVLTMDQAVRNLARFAEWDLQHAVAAATRNPARVARSTYKGVLAEGADADFVVLDNDGNVLRTFIGGVDCSA
ncbi:MAG: N-acetylglucosamine-6-phosphate deacetylase [Terriglobales bacterium]